MQLVVIIIVLVIPVIAIIIKKHAKMNFLTVTKSILKKDIEEILLIDLKQIF